MEPTKLKKEVTYINEYTIIHLFNITPIRGPLVFKLLKKIQGVVTPFYCYWN